MEFQSVNKLLEKSFRENWDRPALSNYKGQDLAYRDVARRIAKLHIAFEQCGLEKGDKVAICSRNQANWGVSFFGGIDLRCCSCAYSSRIQAGQHPLSREPF